MVYEESNMEHLVSCLEGKKLYLFGASGSAKGFLKRHEGEFQVEGFFDNDSKKRLEQIVQYRANGTQYWDGMFDGAAYFQDVFSFTDSEVFIDGGAYIGDTIDEFLKYTKGKFRKIYAFEPDELNYKALVEKYGKEDKIACVPDGLWSSNTTLKFSGCCDDASKITEEGEISVSCKSIDEFIADRVSFIKMDIEGSELEALKGAEKTIRTYHPKLAICIYHKYDDLWTIPLYLHEIVPEYRFYIRHHSLSCSDTVLYAVCDDEDSVRRNG